jgi:hypothetical protein
MPAMIRSSSCQSHASLTARPSPPESTTASSLLHHAIGRDLAPISGGERITGQFWPIAGRSVRPVLRHSHALKATHSSDDFAQILRVHARRPCGRTDRSENSIMT